MQKDLDFTLKVVGGDISSIPGLSDAIEVWQQSSSYLSLQVYIVLSQKISSWRNVNIAFDTSYRHGLNLKRHKQIY